MGRARRPRARSVLPNAGPKIDKISYAGNHAEKSMIPDASAMPPHQGVQDGNTISLTPQTSVKAAGDQSNGGHIFKSRCGDSSSRTSPSSLDGNGLNRGVYLPYPGGCQGYSLRNTTNKTDGVLVSTPVSSGASESLFRGAGPVPRNGIFRETSLLPPLFGEAVNRTSIQKGLSRDSNTEQGGHSSTGCSGRNSLGAESPFSGSKFGQFKWATIAEPSGTKIVFKAAGGGAPGVLSLSGGILQTTPTKPLVTPFEDPGTSSTPASAKTQDEVGAGRTYAKRERGTLGVMWSLAGVVEGSPPVLSQFSSITMKNEFKDRCFEELRLEDYDIAGISHQPGREDLYQGLFGGFLRNVVRSRPHSLPNLPPFESKACPVTHNLGQKATGPSKTEPSSVQKLAGVTNNWSVVDITGHWSQQKEMQAHSSKEVKTPPHFVNEIIKKCSPTGTGGKAEDTCN